MQESGTSIAGIAEFFTNLVGTFQHHYAPAAIRCSDCTHQAGGTGADDDEVRVFHELR